MNIKVFLEGKELKYGEDYILEQPIRIVESKSEKVPRLEGEITFINDTYRLLIEKLVDNPVYGSSGLIQGVPLQLVNACTGLIFFEGEIRADTIDFCDKECFITATPVNASPQKRFLDFFESTYISEPESVRNQIDHPKVMYALVSGGNAVGYIVAVLAGVIIFILKNIDFVVDILRKALTILSFGTLKKRLRNFDLSPAIRAVRDHVTGLAYFHPAPYVRTYINETVALANQKAGTNISFRSSIFEETSPYYNMVYLYADYQRGLDIDFNNLDAKGLITCEPLKTGADLLNDLCKVFNAEWRIIGNELVFERKDFFEQVGADISQYKTCYTLRDAPLPQAIEIKFSDDGSNTEANTNGYYDYFELWNKDPFSPRQKGIEQIMIPFGRTRQVFDNQEDFGFTGKTIELQPYFVAQLGFQAIFSDDKVIRLRRYRAPLLVMDNGRLTNPVLLIVSPERHPYWGNLIVNFNRDLYGKNLYERFYRINNPRGEYMRQRRPLHFNTENLPIGRYAVYDKVRVSRGIGVVTDIETEYYPDQKVTLRGEM